MQATLTQKQQERAEERLDSTAPDRKASGPQRRCLVTRASRPKGGLLRFVVSPEGVLVPDLGEKLPGRGLYVMPDRELLETAISKRLFAKAARQAVQVPEALPKNVAALLRQRALDLIGFAKRAGQAVAGFDRVKSWIEQGRAAVVIQAVDGATGGRQRLAGVAAAVGETLSDGSSHQPVMVELFGQDQLGAAFGRTATVHVAIAPGGLAKQLASTVEQILSYETAAAAQKVAARQRKPR